MLKLPQKFKTMLKATTLAAMTGLGVAAIAAAPAAAEMHGGHGEFHGGARGHGGFHGNSGFHGSFRGGYYGGSGWHGRQFRGGGWHEDWDEPDWDDFAVVAAPWPYYYGPYCDYWDYYYGYCD